VFVVPPERGRGIATHLVKAALLHPELVHVPVMLRTQDAHSLYLKLGFKPVRTPENLMAAPSRQGPRALPNITLERSRDP
jgi:GNAT superfamily N-acetyltransferase